MRVLLVNSHGADPAYGGAERYVRDLGHGLAARGHQARVLSAFPPRADAGIETTVLHDSDWREDRIRRLRNRAGDVIAAPWPRFGRILAELRPDVVHTSNLPGIGTGIWEAARRAGVPIVHTLHDYYLLCPRSSLTRRDGAPCDPSPFLCGLRTRRLARWAGGVRQVIAGSKHLLGVHRGMFEAAEQGVIRLPLAPIGDAGAVPPELPLRTIGYLGALTTSKGIELLLGAAPILAQAGIGLRVAGEGPMQEQVAASGVDYAGRVDGRAKVEFLASCDAGVVPSLWEEPSGPPYVVCEWLAACRPVLTTTRGGLLEAARLPGVVSFEESPAGLSQAALRIRDGTEAERLLAEVPRVDDDEDVQRWLDEHERTYQAAIAMPQERTGS